MNVNGCCSVDKTILLVLTAKIAITGYSEGDREKN